MTQNRWNLPSERPEVYPEETYGEKVKKPIGVSSALITKMVANRIYALTTGASTCTFPGASIFSSLATFAYSNFVESKFVEVYKLTKGR